MINRIVRGDVLSILPRLIKAGESFDVIVADPPYNIGKDFGNGTHNSPIGEYASWAQRWIDACLRLLVPDGLLYVYGFAEVLAHVAVRYPVEQQRWLVWHYTNKTVPSSRFWQRSHETLLCLWLARDGLPRLEIDQIREPYTGSFINGAAGRTRAATPSRYSENGRETVYTAHENGALPRDVLKVPALAGGAGRSERWFLCHSCGGTVHPPAELALHRHCDTWKHSTQKPMKLTRRLIRSKIPEHQAGRALFPFAGSGSECVVADDLGVSFLGIEINPMYVDFARKWLERKTQEICTD